MLQKIKIQITGVHSQNDKALIETEVDVLEGVKDINVNDKNGESWVEFDDSKTSETELFGTIKKLGFQIKAGGETLPVAKEHIYFIKGMHCASCEILIEKKLLTIEGIKSVEAKTNKGEALIEYSGKKPSPERLNSIFREENYIFSNEHFGYETKETSEKGSFFNILAISLFIIAGFLYLNKSGLAGLVNVNSTSSLPSFFALGVLAGVSSCAALIGGMILSMSKQWLQMYSKRNSTMEKLQPHFMFNLGRIVSYAVLGAGLGLLGSRLQISFKFTSFLVIAVSIMMLFLALQMLGVKAFRKFQFTLPRSATRYIADESKFKGKHMPFIMGALTFFLPCGFTITAQGLALVSGNPIQGGLIMLFFALGTAPALLLIGLSAVKFSGKPRLAYKFSRIAGTLVLFFALFNINSQMNVLGISSLNDIGNKFGQSSNNTVNNTQNDLPEIVNGKQVIKMNASSSGYSPKYFKVKSGVPVRWEITDTGTSGCTNAVISNSLFEGAIDLTPGQTSIKEFTQTKPGKYKFSCWMGMVSGIIEVVDGTASANSVFTATTNPNNNDDVIPSGAKGCGCGGGGSCDGAQ